MGLSIILFCVLFSPFLDTLQGTKCFVRKNNLKSTQWTSWKLYKQYKLLVFTMQTYLNKSWEAKLRWLYDCTALHWVLSNTLALWNPTPSKRNKIMSSQYCHSNNRFLYLGYKLCTGAFFPNSAIILYLKSPLKVLNVTFHLVL